MTLLSTVHMGHSRFPPHHFVIKPAAVLLQAEVNYCVHIGRRASVYAPLHISLITALLPHAYIRFSAIIISQGHS